MGSILVQNYGRSKQAGWSGFCLTIFSQTQLAHAHFKSRTVEDSSCNRVFLEELPKTTLHQYFTLSTTILGLYSVVVPLLAAMESQQ